MATMTFEDLKDSHSELDLRLEGRRIVAICKCVQQPDPHRRVFEFSQLNEATLGVIDKDLKAHEQNVAIA